MNIGVLVYPRVEVLDFCGPYEVFRNVNSVGNKGINLLTVSATTQAIDAQGLSINPDYDFQLCPSLDILLIPGGNGTWLIEQDEYQEFVKSKFDHLSHLISVCTGALLVAKLGYLKEDMVATTHLVGIEPLRKLAPDANIKENIRFADNGKIITSGGISAGIDSSLYLVKQIWGDDLAKRIALYMEYDWKYTENEQEYIRPVLE